MKPTFIINYHSVVDLITNSSTELFICSTTKSLETVTEVLKELLEFHNRMTEAPNRYTFSNCFGEISEAKYTYSKDLFTPEVFEKHDIFNSDYEYDSDRIRPESYIQAELAESKLRKTHEYYNSSIYNKDDKQTTPEEDKHLRSLWNDYRAQADKIWTKYGAEKLRARLNLFVDFLRVNQLDFDKSKLTELIDRAVADHIIENNGRYINDTDLSVYTDFPSELTEAYKFFNTAVSWEYTIHKGAILIYSADDNSIPYELFQLIERYLNAARYHLG